MVTFAVKELDYKLF